MTESTLFEVGTAIEDVVGNLKICLQRQDYARLKQKARTLIVRYDNPLIIAYSEELDDEELIKLTLDTFQRVTDHWTIHMLGDIINILARRPKNLITLVNNNVMDILMNVLKKQTIKEVQFATQILNIFVILLEYEDIKALLERNEILNEVIPKMNNFARDKDYAVANLTIIRLCCTNEKLLKEVIKLNGALEVVKTMNTFPKEAAVAYNGAAVLVYLLDENSVCQKLLDSSITAILTKLLHHNNSDEKAALELCHCLRKLIPFRKSRIEAEQQKLASYLGKTIVKHSQSNLTVVQYAFMCLIIMSTSAECRESCRLYGADDVIAKCIEMYAYNSAVVRDGCIALASLIYNGDYIARFVSIKAAKALSTAAKTLGDEDHKITLRVLASAYKEATLYDVCVPSIIEYGGVDSLMMMLNYQYQDKTIVSLVLSALAKLSANPASYDAFMKSNAALVIPSIMSRYMDKHWVIVRSSCLILRNLAMDPKWRAELVAKDSFKQIVRAMVHYLRNCKSIILVSLEAIHRILSAPTISPKMQDDRVVKALNIVEQRFHRKSHTIATYASDCMNWIATKPAAA